MRKISGKEMFENRTRLKQALTSQCTLLCERLLSVLRLFAYPPMDFALVFAMILALLSALSATSLMAEDHDRGRFSMSAGCGKSGASTGVFTLTTTDGDNRVRTYRIQVPADYNPQRSYSLNFVFHGAGGTITDSYAQGLQNVPGASESGIFVFPQGIPFQYYGVGWDDTDRGYDMPFFDKMLRDVEASYCIDTREVFVAGFSWGGDFSTALACNRGDTIRAIAVNSSDDEYDDNSNYLTYQDLPCPSHEHPAIRFEHALGGDPVYPAPDFATTSKLFQYFNQCGTTSKPVQSSTSVMSCVSYLGCATEYIECPFDPKIGHNIPPNWAQDTWDFFSSFREKDHHADDE